jgi:hypothetical protein
MKVLDGMIGDAGEHAGELGLRVDVVELQLRRPPLAISSTRHHILPATGGIRFTARHDRTPKNINFAPESS